VLGWTLSSDAVLGPDPDLTCYTSQELAQLDYGCLRYLPSELAAAAMLVAHAHIGDRRRLGALSATSGYSVATLQVLTQRRLRALTVHGLTPPQARMAHNAMVMLEPPGSQMLASDAKQGCPSRASR
jgi:hypothetical protein